MAERLIALETGALPAEPGQGLAVLTVLEKLRPELNTLMGNGGYRALLSRSLALASEEAPWLRSALVGADGTLSGLDLMEWQAGAQEEVEGSVVLIAQMAGLLTAFIGEKLTLRLAHEIWPALAAKNCD